MRLLPREGKMQTGEIRKGILNGWRRAAKVALVLVLLVFLLGFGANVPPTIEDVEIFTDTGDYSLVRLSVRLSGSRFSGNRLWCYVGDKDNVADITDEEWVPAEGGVCEFIVGSGNYYMYAKDAFGKTSTPSEQDVEINEIVSIQLDYTKGYLAIGGTKQFSASLFILGEVDETITWTSSDDSVATVTDAGFVVGHKNGTVTITATASNGIYAEAEVLVTDLIAVAGTLELKNREFLKAYQYTEEEAALLDEILASRVEEAGYGTRSGVIAAARFMTLEWPSRVHYFYENGRLNNHGQKTYCDGEGRYYHKGLYLSESKFDDIVASVAGPAIWGAPLTNYEDHPPMYIRGASRPNGLDCSGFVSWTLLNGGFDVGDSGAGDYTYIDDDLCDLGERVWITRELMFSGRVKVGDLIGADGHAAIIVGMDDEYIYIAESLIPGVMINKLTLESELIYSPTYTWIMLMDTEYGEMGNNYTEMW
jgi:hypothetical protein